MLNILKDYNSIPVFEDSNENIITSEVKYGYVAIIDKNISNCNIH